MLVRLLKSAVIVASLAMLLACAGGCRSHTSYDKHVRLYLDSPAEMASGRAPENGWYVVGARTGDGIFWELDIGHPAQRGEPLELRRDGEALLARAAGVERQIHDVPLDTRYIAWALRRRATDVVRLDFDPVGIFTEGLINSLLDDDDDEERLEADSKKRKTRKSADRGERYQRSHDESQQRRRTREDN